MSERLYDNPTPVGRVTVRVARRHPRVMSHKDRIGEYIRITAAWRICVDGQQTDYLVIHTWIGATIIDHTGAMMTSWHSGIEPGDLARLAANGATALTYKFPEESS